MAKNFNVGDVCNCRTSIEEITIVRIMNFKLLSDKSRLYLCEVSNDVGLYMQAIEPILGGNFDLIGTNAALVGRGYASYEAIEKAWGYPASEKTDNEN